MPIPCACLMNWVQEPIRPKGAALAIAVLNYLHERGIRTVATTHYSELKVYALITRFVENACCEFNVDTLSPTYRLLIGVPGKSNAFAISKKLGLPDHIIEAATAQIGTQDKSFEDLLSDLEESRITIEKERREIASYKEEIKALREKLQQKNEKIDMAKDRILREANEQAREILQDAKETADETIRIFQKAGPNVPLKTLEKEREKLRGEIGKKNDKLALKTAPTRSGKKVRAENLKLGDTVKILSMGLVGTVTRFRITKEICSYSAVSCAPRSSIKDLAYGEAKAEPEKPVLQRSHTGSVKMSKSMHVSAEINLSWQNRGRSACRA